MDFVQFAMMPLDRRCFGVPSRAWPERIHRAGAAPHFALPMAWVFKTNLVRTFHETSNIQKHEIELNLAPCTRKRPSYSFVILEFRMLGSNRIPEDALGTLLGPQQVCRRPCLWTCRTYAEQAGPKFWFWGWLHLLVTTCHNESMPLSSLATLGIEEILDVD